MNHLVACPQCGRQYDATDRMIGSRFRCSCGSDVVVGEPSAHAAAVVRCTACGAPREGEATSCRYCGSTFTLRDQDLDTICPTCMARVASTARFCHACGSPILVDQARASGLTLLCPGCGSERLRSRRLGHEGLAVSECAVCGGLWLDNTVFEIVATRARIGSLGDLGLAPPQPAIPPSPPAPGQHLYRPCPVCRNLMNRHNYGGASGVILDLCRAHGIWFDRDELPRILTWIRAGGEEKARRREQEAAQQALRLHKIENLALDPQPHGWTHASGEIDLLEDLVAALGSGLRHLFQHR
jgi:Zn-finger nucleic acid-binding protein